MTYPPVARHRASAVVPNHQGVSNEQVPPLSKQILELAMAEENNGGIIRWRDLLAIADAIRQELATSVDAIRKELKQETRKLEAGQDHNTKEITKLVAEVSSMKTELRILGAIFLALLLSIIGLFINHIAP